MATRPINGCFTMFLPGRPRRAPNRCARGRASLGVVAPRLQRLGDGRVAAGPQRVAEGDREIALPALEADAADRAAFGLAQEIVLAATPRARAGRARRARGGRRSRRSGSRSRTCSTGRRAGSRRSRRRGCRSRRGTRPGSRPCARSSGTRCSDAHRARKGATIACVGQTSMQAMQLPQWSDTAALSGSATSTKISPRKNIEPASRSSASVCLPRQPMPLRAASSTSSTGAESVKTRWPNGPIESASRSASARRRWRRTL